MDIDIASWLGLALRWLHMITGIAWIGSSFYFIWLDNSLSPPATAEDKKAGVAGELWAVHGGGFYHKKKYKTAPGHMPPELHWFKWEAYFTWISGFLLLCLMYYYGAELYLIDRSKFDLTTFQATFTGLGFIAAGWLFYDELCKTKIGENGRLFGCIWFAFLTLAAWGLSQIFTGRGAFIHVGAMIGTAMAFNVFAIIIPNQKIVVADLIAGRAPDPKLGLKAKQRSLHNNYMTLPVLLIMISNHYPELFGHAYNWLLLALLSAAAWPARQFFNLKHKGVVDYRYLAAGAAGFIAVMLLASSGKTVSDTSGETVTAAEARTIIRTHCSSCHSDTPVFEGITEPPTGVMFDTMDDIRKYAERIRARAVTDQTMPQGNPTNMTDEERRRLGVWLDSLRNRAI